MISRNHVWVYSSCLTSLWLNFNSTLEKLPIGTGWLWWWWWKEEESELNDKNIHFENGIRYGLYIYMRSKREWKGNDSVGHVSCVYIYVNDISSFSGSNTIKSNNKLICVLRFVLFLAELILSFMLFYFWIDFTQFKKFLMEVL